jgi:hypothetical protein
MSPSTLIKYLPDVPTILHESRHTESSVLFFSRRRYCDALAFLLPNSCFAGPPCPTHVAPTELFQNATATRERGRQNEIHIHMSQHITKTEETYRWKTAHMIVRGVSWLCVVNDGTCAQSHVPGGACNAEMC